MEDFSHPNFSTYNDSYIFCADPSNELHLVENRFCESGEWDHTEISDDEYKIEKENDSIVIPREHKPPVSLDIDSKYYCVGYYIFHYN